MRKRRENNLHGLPNWPCKTDLKNILGGEMKYCVIVYASWAYSWKKFGRLQKDFWKSPQISRLNWRNVEEMSKWLTMSQIKREGNFVEETLIVSTMWKAPCDIFYNLIFPHCGNYYISFLQFRKNGLTFFTKLEVK